MAVPSLLLDFAVVLIAAEIGGTVFRRLHLPRAVGMLIAGIALGPFTPGYVVSQAELADLALLGAVFMMFSAGLSFDIRGFRKLGLSPFLLAGFGVGLSFVAGFALGILFGWPFLGSVFIGLILTSTSTTLGLKFLADFGLVNVKASDLVTVAILVDDVIALSLMTLLVGFLTPSTTPAGLLVIGLLMILLLATLLIWLGSHALPRILRITDVASPSSVVMVAISFGLLIAFAFAFLGLPPLVGAFFAGSIVASTQYGSRVTRHMTPVTAIFMAVFFASIGFLIDPRLLPGIAALGIAIALVAVLSKAIPALFFLRRVTKVPAATAWPLAMVFVPRAEISLIIAQYGITVGGPPELLSLAMSVMVGTALLPAPLAKLSRGWEAKETPATVATELDSSGVRASALHSKSPEGDKQ